MDRAITQSRLTRLKRPATIVVTVVAAISGAVTLANIDFSSHRVDRDKLNIETVQHGTMDIKVSADGQLLSKTIEELVAQAPGRVAKADIKPGAVVQAGQVLVELTNPQLIASQEEAESAWEGAMAELDAAQAEFQTNILNQEAVLNQVQYNLERAKAKAEQNEALDRNQLIAAMDLKNSRIELEQVTHSYSIEQSRLERIRENMQAQLAVKRFRVTQLARALDRAKTQTVDLKVVAGISGIVQAINVEVGQQLQAGSPIGRIARLDKLYAELKVPAREATQVQAGQKVVVDTRNGTVNGVVIRVDPGVTDGTVVVDADLQGALPAGARPQLQVEGTIYVSQLPNTLFVGKPSYVKNNAAIAVYKLDPDGQYARRVTIKAGKVSLNYLQVLQGLEAGDRIITSEIGEWQGQDRILLK